MKKILLTLCLILPCMVFAGEWNEKPVMCADRIETFKTIKEKNEIIIFSGLEYAKVRNETGLAKVPAKLPFSFYVNFKTGTYTVLEHHPSYNTYCVLAYGTNLQSFVGGIK